MSWNVRGLGLPEKCDAVRDTISISHPHIVCIQESKLSSIDSTKSKAFLPASLSSFTYSPAGGSCGGLVMAWNPDLFSVEDISQTNHSLTVSFISTSSNYSFTVMNVYAASDHRDTDMFLAEFQANAQLADTNWLVIGDFNLTRTPSDKNNDLFDWRLANKFNSAIDGLALIELPILDRLYTWSNKRESPTLARSSTMPSPLSSLTLPLPHASGPPQITYR